MGLAQYKFKKFSKTRIMINKITTLYTIEAFTKYIQFRCLQRDALNPVKYM